MTSPYDLSSTLLPFPAGLDTDSRELSDMDELGSLLVRRGVAPHASVSAGVAGDIHLPFPGNLFTPTAGIQAAHDSLATMSQHGGILRLSPDDDALSAYDDVAEDIGLLNGFRIPTDELLQHDKRNTIVLSSPNGVSGRIANVQEIVRLARHFQLVIVDERLTAFSMRRLTPLVLEWENIVFVQRFPFIMPGQTKEFAWIVHPASMKNQVAEHSSPVDEETVTEALTYGGINTFQAARQAARLKSHLYREMRKMSVLSVPYPSWSNSLLARIERGNRDDVVRELGDRGFSVYVPPHPNLLQHIRLTAISEEATMALRKALVEINRQLG